MPSERVLSLPLNSDEIIEIILQRVDKRLRSDCFLHPANTYNGFSLEFECKLKFQDMMLGRETLVWDRHIEPKMDIALEVQTLVDAYPVDDAEKAAAVSGTFDSGNSPNRTREEHDLGIPVETQEGKRKVIRHRKIKEVAE